MPIKPADSAYLQMVNILTITITTEMNNSEKKCNTKTHQNAS